MILDKTIKIKVNGKMVKKYKELGFDVKQYDIIDLPIEHLSKYSHQKVMCACDICGEKKEIKYNNYCGYIKRDSNNQYTCKICNLDKRKKTCKEKYGVEFVAKLESSKEKAKETMIENRTVKFFCNPKFKEKMIELYGVDNPSNSELLKEKRVNTYLERYGVENPSYFEIFKEKKINTCLKNYGVEYPAQSKEIKIKKENTCLKNYGVRNPSQSPEIHKKQQYGFVLKHHEGGLHYRGTYEKDFIDFSIKNNIKIENFKGTIPYYFDGKNRKYFPDFYIKDKNLIVEIKSTYTYNFDIEINKAKRKAAISSDFNFIFIIDKNYDYFSN